MQPRVSYLMILWGIVLLFLVGSCDRCKSRQVDQPKNTALPTSLGLSPSSPLVTDGPPLINKGIIRTGMTCYMNSAVQILASFYPTAFNLKTGPLAAAGRDLIRAVRGQDQVDEKEIKKRAAAFFATLNLPTIQGGIDWNRKFCDQEDALDLITGIISWITKPAFSEAGTAQGKDGNRLCDDTMNDRHLVLKDTTGQASTMQSLFNAISYNIPFKSYQQSNWPLIITAHHYIDSSSKAKRNPHFEILNSDHLTIPTTKMVDAPHDLHYQLVGILQHRGTSIKSGHYVAYTKVGEQWIEYNDCSITILSEAEAQEVLKKGYAFFYKKIDKKAAGGA
eukprot:gene24-34_t